MAIILFETCRHGQHHRVRISKRFLIKDQKIISSVFVGNVASVPITQLCHFSSKAALDNTGTNGYGCVPIKLYLRIKKGAAGQN